MGVSLSVNITFASEDSKGLLPKVMQALRQKSDTLNIQSASLGIDQGLIAKTIVGLGRTLERNPNSKGEHDYYLVKDRMRLGFELGAGFVVAGSITYVQEWILVYPLPKSREGLLSRGLVINFFFKGARSNQARDKLPSRYALFRESSIEGKGRLRFGGNSTLLLGNQTSLSKVKLETIIIKAHQKTRETPLKIMRQRSEYTEVAYELWLKLSLIDLPIFKANGTKGELQRTYYDVPMANLNQQEQEVIISELFSGEGDTHYKQFKLKRSLVSRFKEITLDFSLFFAFDRKRLTRIDDVEDRFSSDPTSDEAPTQVSTNRTWQWENRGEFETKTPAGRDQKYSSRMLLTGKPTEDAQGVTENVENPQLKIQLKVEDAQTTFEEYERTYQTFINEFISPLENLKEVRVHDFLQTPESKTFVEIQYNEDALSKITRASKDLWYRALSAVTQKSPRYWEQADQGGLHSRDRRRLRQSRVALEDIQLNSQVQRIILATLKARKAQAENNSVLALRHLLSGLRSSFVIGNGAFDTRLLKVINKIVGEKNYYASTKFRLFHEGPSMAAQNSSMTLTQERGSPLWKEQGQYQFLFQDPSEIYFFFDERQPWSK